MTKEQILVALEKWIAQRPSLEFGNYGDMRTYRAELRQIAKDRRDAETLLRAVALRPSITADDLIVATRAYSGRLQFKGHPGVIGLPDKKVTIDYCTGQYWPTEYRKAACAVLALALWERKRADMPKPDGFRVESWGKWDGNQFRREKHVICYNREPAEIQLKDCGGQQYGHVQELYGKESAGDWLRSSFRREFGRSIAQRWFN